MDNPKIVKLKTEIGNTKKKIIDLNAKLRELERKMVILENEEIVAAVRSEKISDRELSELMQSIRNKTPSKKPAQNNKVTEEINYGTQSE